MAERVKQRTEKCSDGFSAASSRDRSDSLKGRARAQSVSVGLAKDGVDLDAIKSIADAYRAELGFHTRQSFLERRSVAAEKLAVWGHAVWDGVSTEVRDSYATSTQQVRVVQYDSCRGLEGWIVIALGIDEFFRYKELRRVRGGCGGARSRTASEGQEPCRKTVRGNLDRGD